MDAQRRGKSRPKKTFNTLLIAPPNIGYLSFMESLMIQGPLARFIHRYNYCSHQVLAPVVIDVACAPTSQLSRANFDTLVRLDRSVPMVACPRSSHFQPPWATYHEERCQSPKKLFQEHQP